MTSLPKSATVAVIGAGTMGAGIAQVAAAAGHPVLLYDIAVGAVAKGIAGVKAGLDKLVERQKMSEHVKAEFAEIAREVEKFTDEVRALRAELAIAKGEVSPLKRNTAA